MPVTRVVVNLPDKAAYNVRIGPGLLDAIGAHVAESVPGATAAFLVADSNVGFVYADRARASLEGAGLRTTCLTVPAGEASKSTAQLGQLWSAMADARLDRSSVVVALGGGVVGDLAGFAASTYMRGIEFVQVPTSLLAMVDSSVGGKTGIDLDQGKNLVGCFKQPACVTADTAALFTLPAREWACGFGEVAKSAALCSDDFFFWLGDNASTLLTQNGDAVVEAITRCVVFKADVVAADEQERSGVRAQLNYGHTLGHAIEKLAGFGTFSHGACVAEGMRFAARLGAQLVGTPLDLVEAQDTLLNTLGLASLGFRADPDQVLDAMRSDKKAQAGSLRFVMLRDVGDAVVQAVDEAVLREHLDAWARS